MPRVLVVDDSVFMRTIIADMLGTDGRLDVIGTAIDGRDALKKIEALEPDVITLDIEMPRMDGLEVLQRLAETGSSAKVLVLSSLTPRDAETTARALRLGADDFMFKPKDITQTRGIERELVAKIFNLVDLPARAPEAAPLDAKPAGIAVVVGSSAGGPPMLDRLLSSLPAALPAAVIVTQHMPPGFTAPLTERLRRISPMPVKESENGDILRRGSVVVSRAGVHTVVSATLTEDGERGGRIVHSSAPPLHSVRPAVDVTFSSAARSFRERTLSILLSGMGKDGGDGTATVKRCGGVTMVCDAADCLVYGMARSALERGCVDLVVPFRRMHREIERIVYGMGGAAA
ncbi:MAG: chemotaxis protein CheB [Methanomicrobiales archaeon]|nr:chemotaxis protein CheB [Methanomicrobiales archaeon]MDI6877326.1 chemotaxis protein CheB [Methanomicrobiales archaeon]